MEQKTQEEHPPQKTDRDFDNELAQQPAKKKKLNDYISFDSYKSASLIGQLSVRDVVRQFRNSSPSFAQPQELCTFCIDENGSRITGGKSELVQIAT